MSGRFRKLGEDDKKSFLERQRLKREEIRKQQREQFRDAAKANRVVVRDETKERLKNMMFRKWIETQPDCAKCYKDFRDFVAGVNLDDWMAGSSDEKDFEDRIDNLYKYARRERYDSVRSAIQQAYDQDQALLQRQLRQQAFEGRQLQEIEERKAQEQARALEVQARNERARQAQEAQLQQERLEFLSAEKERVESQIRLLSNRSGLHRDEILKLRRRASDLQFEIETIRPSLQRHVKLSFKSKNSRKPKKSVKKSSGKSIKKSSGKKKAAKKSLRKVRR